MLTKRMTAHRNIYLLSLTATVFAVWVVFFYAPIQIRIQKVFYFHVVLACVGMVSSLVAAIASNVYLNRHTDYWDDLMERKHS